MLSMKAARIHTYGSVDVLKYEDAPRPVPGKDEVLIRAQATSVNPFDCAVRAGYLTGWYQYSFPLVLGLDVSGIVEECGPGVSKFSPGDAVFARTDPSRNGAYAEYVLAHVDEISLKPKSLDHRHAAAVPHAALTAWALIETAGLAKGQTVFIPGAAGGVGHIAVQFAKLRGARVIGSASGHNLGYLRELGVDDAIDYTTTPFETVVKDVDVVFDTVGGETQQRAWSVLKPGGILLSIVQPPSQDTAASLGVRQQFVSASQKCGGMLAQFASMLDAGQVKPTVSAVLPLQKAQQAHQMVEGRHTRGKLVLEIVN